jgi:probable F420-dependent oxidoreductase
MLETPELRFGYSGSPFAAIEDLVDLARRAERAGFDTFGFADLPGGMSPLIAFAALATQTTTIRFTPFVLNTGLWNPATIARDLATLQRVSDGRLDVALGSGIPQPAVASLMPPTRDARFERLAKTVSAVKLTFAESGITPGYGENTPPPILIAGTSDRVRKFAAEQADGYIIAGVPPVPKVSLPPGHLLLPEREATAEYLDRLRGYAGARAATFEIGVGAPVVLTDDIEAATAELAAIHTYLTPEQVLASPKILVGDAESVTEQILERRENLGISYTMMRGASPEDLAPVLADARARQ